VVVRIVLLGNLSLLKVKVCALIVYQANGVIAQKQQIVTLVYLDIIVDKAKQPALAVHLEQQVMQNLKNVMNVLLVLLIMKLLR